MDGNDAARAAVDTVSPAVLQEGAANGTATPTPTRTPGPVPGADIVAGVALEWGFRERVLASLGLLVVVLLLSRFILPWAIERARNTYRDRLHTEQVGRRLQQVDQAIPFEVTTYYLVRTLQLGLSAVAILVVLALWGQTRLAIQLVELFLRITPQLVRTLFSVGLIVAAYVGVDMLEDFVDRMARKSGRLDEHQGEIVFRVLQVVLLVSAGLVVLSIWNVDLSGLLVGAGFLGIVVGMAARQTLGSLLAGFVLMFSKPFEVGDWVEIAGEEGVVTDITIVNTRLENFDGEYVVMPNDVISNSTIVNRTRKGRLRIRLDVGVDYEVEPGHAESVAKDAIKDVDEVMSVPRPQVVPKAFGDSAIVLETRFWIDKPSSRRRWRAKAAVLRAIYDAFDEEDIGIPFPQRTLSGRAEGGEVRVAGEAPTEAELPSEAAED